MRPRPQWRALLLDQTLGPLSYLGGGLIAGAGAAYLLLSGLPKTGSNADTALPHQQLLRAYNEQLPLMPEAVSYLRELSAEIVRRQKEDPTSLRVEKTLMLLSIFDGDLAKKMPASLPQGTEAVIRVSATDYKIMLNWTLCGTAAIYSPEMVDKVRATVSTIGCPYFGVWTPGAAGW